ncbi:MAG: hypothetical protein ABFD49_06380 [Armatimonadota bacterium]|nr:hypothetical protein [bacterium]
MADWLSAHTGAITIWCAALCTFAIYSVLYAENKFYRLFEHIFLGLATGYGVYITWSELLLPKWWQPMVVDGQWYWIFPGILGSMFFFMYSRKHAWINRVIFGLIMGLLSGGIFREFYELYFPQMGASMKPIAAPGMSIWDSLNVVVFYIILFSAMSYFFFSFDHKNVAIKKTTSAGRWFLMIGFGAIFGATVMGRMTLFIGRFNFLVNEWVPQVRSDWSSGIFRIVAGLAAVALIALVIRKFRRTNATGE